MTVKDFNETHTGIFAKPHPVNRALQILKEWMGSGHFTLDVGCGSGFYTDLCRMQGNRIVGIDITAQVHTAHAMSLAVCMGNVEVSLPFPDNMFTQILCIEVVEHLLQPDLMLAEIRRVLRPGGMLIMTTPNYAYWVLRILYLFGRLPVGLSIRYYNGVLNRVSVNTPPPWREPHIRFFSPTSLRQFLSQGGFEVESLRVSFVSFPSGLAPYVPWPIGLPLRAAGKLIGNLNYLGDVYPSLLGAGLLVKAIKQ